MVTVVVAVLWGALAGALLPRAAYRLSVPPEEPWRDRCPEGHPLGGLLGRARCPECARAYGPGPVVPALLTALLCAGLALATGPRPELVVWLAAGPVGVLLAIVDVRVQRLPDVLTLPLAAVVPALLGVAALLPDHAGHWPTALLAALALGAGYLVLHEINPGGMGFGDVKLALGAGAALGWYGWRTVLLGTFVAFVCGAVYGGVLAVVRRTGRGTAVPFGPFLLAGAYAGVVLEAAAV
ncbi:prepilin peptidase [Streptomyces sp. NPDC088387]|uniref:prepilin peptidase n=1 Tax=Streptomyces sp. NPDC088387 TaxID=3365859 RepID=UPI0037F74E2E